MLAGQWCAGWVRQVCTASLRHNQRNALGDACLLVPGACLPMLAGGVVYTQPITAGQSCMLVYDLVWTGGPKPPALAQGVKRGQAVGTFALQCLT